MGHRVIYVERCEYLRLYLDNLKVEIKENEILFPIADIQILVIDNYKSHLSVPLINKLTENNVCTILCGVDHLPKSYILPMNGHFSSSGNIEKQIVWNPYKKEELHALIVKHKILNQIEILKENNRSFASFARTPIFNSSGTSTPNTDNPSQIALRYDQAFSPIPPAKIIASAPPINPI